MQCPEDPVVRRAPLVAGLLWGGCPVPSKSQGRGGAPCVPETVWLKAAMSHFSLCVTRDSARVTKTRALCQALPISLGAEGEQGAAGVQLGAAESSPFHY